MVKGQLTAREIEDRERKAMKIVTVGNIVDHGDHFVVDGYRVTMLECTCRDYQYRSATCKHMFAIRKFNELRNILQDFISERNITLDEIISTLTASPRTDLHNALLTTARSMQSVVTQNTEMHKALLFQVRYWWPHDDASAGSPFALNHQYDNNDAENVQVWGKNDPGFRESTKSLSQIAEYCRDNDMEPDQPIQVEVPKKINGRWMRQYQVSIHAA